MKKFDARFLFLLLTTGLILAGQLSFVRPGKIEQYKAVYVDNFHFLRNVQSSLLNALQETSDDDSIKLSSILNELRQSRIALKKVDFWARYFEPIAYKKINGPLPVEWETEVFEKFEKPYKRIGAGLSLLEQYLEEPDLNIDAARSLLLPIDTAIQTFLADSITVQLNTYHHFFLCNRLFLLNLAAIYTTGFECPDKTQVIPELLELLGAVQQIYSSFNDAFVDYKLSDRYTNIYEGLISFVKSQSTDINQFDHFNFIRRFVNPLYALNQELIDKYNVRSTSFVDYSLNKSSKSIFSKNLYFGQNTKGVFLRVNDSIALRDLKELGKMFFYDPILSGNNQRSCASCHQPAQCFNDTLFATHLGFDRGTSLARNTPSLVNSIYNHLIMLDGKHISLQDQAKAVITNPIEMNSKESDLLKKVMSCKDYKLKLERLLPYTPLYDEVNIDHITSAITYYYGEFSYGEAIFDQLMNSSSDQSDEIQKGFNLFMGKAQCATCHFVPHFNGVKPPYVGSEFEVIGVPETKNKKELSDDKGRFEINPAFETLNAFRTGSLRNISRTAPYMHNAVFKTLEEVIDFYNAGGGQGLGIDVPNQTLSTDSLHLTKEEKRLLIVFMQSLNEEVAKDSQPERLPLSTFKILNKRKPGGEY